MLVRCQLLEQSIAFKLLVILCLYTTPDYFIVQHFFVILSLRLHALVLSMLSLDIMVSIEVTGSEFFALEVLEPALMECLLASWALGRASKLLLHSVKPASRRLDVVQRSVRLVESRGTKVEKIGRCMHINTLTN